MIAHVFKVEATHDALLRHCVERLRAHDPGCKIAVFDSARSPLPEPPPGCHFYRRRGEPVSEFEGELSMLAAAARAFPGATWITRVRDLASPPVMGAEDRWPASDFWACRDGYLIRRPLVPRLIALRTSRRAEPIAAALAEVVSAAGGSVTQGSGGGITFEYRTGPPLSSPEPMRAQAFASVATSEMADEAEILVRTLRRHHSEALVLACDRDVAERVLALGFPNIEILPITSEMRREAEEASRDVVRHDPYWKPEAIALKFPALRTAISRHGPSHLLDADIVVCGSLHSGGPWQADVVLSPHYEQDTHAPWVVAHGFFNAGYLMARHTGVVDRWEEMFRAGEGGFYEQKCLDLLDQEFVAAWFGQAHNFGRWRWESPSRRPIVSLHHKLSLGDHTPELRDLNEAVRDAIREDARI